MLKERQDCYRAWMPRLHHASETLIQKLTNWKPQAIHRNFPKSAFCVITFNFGPQVVCNGHRDHLNWAVGGCVITAAGNFDYQKGGHLVLVEPKKILEFPPGCSVIIQSACLTHGNLPIGKDEKRVSMTQYTAGGLFRFVEYGFRTAKKFEKEDKKGKALLDEQRWERWENGMGLYSTVEELKAMWVSED